MENNDSGKLSKKNLWGFAFGAIPVGLLGYVFTLKYIEFFYDDLRLLPLYFIIGQVIYMAINAINDPLLGQLSDRTNREKWGSRRLIYIRWGGPIWVLTFLLVWFPWSYDNQLIIFLHYVISICLFDTMLTLVILVWMALLPEMTTDIDERNKATFLTILIVLITVMPILLILGPVKPTSVTFQYIMIMIAIVSTIFLFLISKMCEEKPEFQKDEFFPLWKSIKETAKSKSFLLFVGFNFTFVFTGSLGISYLFLYILILGNNATVSIIYFLIFVFVGNSAFIICMKLSPKWGMRKVILRFGLLRVIGAVVIFILALLIPSEPAILILWVGFVLWTFFGGYGIFAQGPLMYLSVDDDEIKHGIRREGMFLGINALFTKPAMSLGPIIATLILVSFGYIQGADTQSASTLIGIKIIFLLVPAIATAIGLIFMYFYPLHGERLREMMEKLEEIHKEKQEKIQ